jgi:hypothetical protein
MAAKKAKRARKRKKPEGDIAAAADLKKLHYILKAGELKIDKKKLREFINKKLKGIEKPTVEFVAKNAPFMRRRPIPPV